MRSLHFCFLTFSFLAVFCHLSSHKAELPRNQSDCSLYGIPRAPCLVHKHNPPPLLIGWNDCIFTFFCYPFTELGVSMKSPLFSLQIYTEFDKKSVGLALMTIHLMIALRKLCAGTCRVFLLRFEYSVPITFKLNGKIEFAKCICERCM